MVDLGYQHLAGCLVDHTHSNLSWTDVRAGIGAHALLSEKNFGHAIAGTREVLRREPRHFDALSGLGLILQDLGDDKTGARGLSPRARRIAAPAAHARRGQDPEGQARGPRYLEFTSRMQSDLAKPLQRISPNDPAPASEWPAPRVWTWRAGSDGHLCDRATSARYCSR
jgi:hypothetical protein